MDQVRNTDSKWLNVKAYNSIHLVSKMVSREQKANELKLK